MAWTRILPQRGARISVSPGVTVAWRVREKGRPILAVTIAAHLARDLRWQAKQRVAVMMDDPGERVRLEPCDVAAEGFALHGGKGTAFLSVGFQIPGLALAKSMRSEPAAYEVEDGGLNVTLPGWARASVAVALPVPPVVVAPPAAPAPTARWTEPRKTMLRTLWQAGETTARIVATLNSMAGAPVDYSAVDSYAVTVLRLPRRGRLAPSRPPRVDPPQPAAAFPPLPRTPRGDTLPPDPLRSIPADDADEARKMMRSGKVGAKTLAEYFGWPHEDAVRIAAAIRDEMAAAA